MVGKGEDSRSSATISSQSKVDTYAVGEENSFASGVVLKKIEPNRIIFVNQGRLEFALFQEEEAPTIDEKNVLDLTEVTRQYAITILPMKPLCRSDCRGLCAKCGVDLNQEECHCGGTSVDSRWNDLVKLLNQAPR